MTNDVQKITLACVGGIRGNGIGPSSFNDAMRDRLQASGLFGEINSWKLRIFVPRDAGGVEILSKVLDRYLVATVSEREAA
jgi:hypothetical protein